KASGSCWWNPRQVPRERKPQTARRLFLWKRPMRYGRAELHEFFRIAVEALARYKLRTSLSVLGVVLGVAAVIAMMSVSEGARREALNQGERWGVDTLGWRT